MRTLINNFHKRLSFGCVTWAVFQFLLAHALGRWRPIAYPVATGCAIATAVLWLTLPALARKFSMKTISTRYYGMLRNMILPSFFLAFVYPFIFYWLSKDKFHFGVLMFLGISAAFSIILAYRVYGESMYKFMGGKPKSHGA